MFFVVLCSILAMLFCCVLFDCTSTSLTSFAFFCLNHIGDVFRFNNKVWLVFMYTIFTINVGWHRDRPMTSRLLAFQKLLYCYIVTLGVDVVCLSPWHNLVAVHSADQGGTEYIKLHHLTDFNTTSSGMNKGSYIIPKTKGHVLEFKLITPEKVAQLKKLVFSKKDTSQSFGYDWNNVTIQTEISLLMQQ